MKNKMGLFLVILMSFFAVYLSANSQPAQFVSEQVDILDAAVINTPQLDTPQNRQNDAIQKVDMLMNRYMDNLRTCTPIHINQYQDIFGFKFGFKFDVNGWVNGKCSYRFSGELNSLGKDIREVFNVKLSDNDLAQFKPVVECNFSQEELNLLVDVIMDSKESDKEYIRTILNNPGTTKEKKSPALTPQEERLISILASNNTCRIINQEELMQSFTNILEKL